MVDPYGVESAWDSLAGLTPHERMDLLMLFPEDMDIERNPCYEERLDRYMPPGADGIPSPRVTGKTMSRYSSIRPCGWSVLTSWPLP